ncbi:calmodulin binding protein PICBP [Capsella rubella]|nr:calmodulin binding protein PICBP [Capsella rubella]
MVQRKTCLVLESSFNSQPETRFGQEHLKNLGPEMMMMKRTKPRRKLKDNTTVSSQSGKSQELPKHDLVVKVTGGSGSPNYMKGTSSSEARKENKKRFNLSRNQKNQTGSKHDSRYGVNKERSYNKPSSRIGRGLTKPPSFKRCSQKSTCSSTLKDSKFPEYLMLNHGETYDQVNGTSVLKVCPYTYCSLNGHLHSVQYPPLKSFISSRRQSLKSQKSVKMEASKEEFVKIRIEENKEFEHGNGAAFEIDIDSQISETVSQGAPRSETDSDDYSDSAEMVMISEGDHAIELKECGLEETLVDEVVNEVQEKANRDGDACLLKESDLEETLVDNSVNEVEEKANRDGDADQSCCSDPEVISIIKNSEADNAIEETMVDESVKYLEERANIDEDENQSGCFDSDVIDMTKNSEADNRIEETLVDDSVKEIQEKEDKDEDEDEGADQFSCFISEVIDMTKNSAAGNAIEDKDDAGKDTLKDKAEDCKEESQDQTEVMLMTKENTKVPFNRTRKPCNQEESESTISWTIIKCKKPVAETEDLRAFNPREPNYLPIAVEEDPEKVDLKHQDIDERRNSEDWMLDFALQRAVSKLAPARKRKVALLVEAFETVQPTISHGREPAPVLSYGRHLQACN